MTGPGPSGDRCIDACAAIDADLAAQSRTKRRHFLPALALVVFVASGVFATMGMRPDLLTQPAWRLCIQVAAWAMCLLVFPAIGVGLLFPSRAARIGLAALGTALAVVAATGWPPLSSAAVEAGGRPCWMLVVGSAVMFFAIGILSGAFAQRRATSSVFWVVGGLGLCSLAAITWVCPSASAPHVLGGHLGPAAGFMVIAALIGTWVHRSRSRATD